MTKQALVCGAGGFVGVHLVKRLKHEGYWIRGVDIKYPEYSESHADEFLLLDLRVSANSERALEVAGGFDEVYQLAADRGGAGYMKPGECDMMENNALINIYMTAAASRLARKPKYFFSSSVCVYKDMPLGAAEISEREAYPAFPDNEYGWEKLYAERMLTAFGQHHNMPTRIARFHTTYGPEANWDGGREKAADAICRKVAMAKEGDNIEVWGDGRAVRAFTFIDDLIDGIIALMESGIEEPTNIGTDEYVTVDQLANTIIRVSGKNVGIKHVAGPVGVESRNFSTLLIKSTGWRPKYTLEQGIAIHYPWVQSQVERTSSDADVSRLG
jgi:GDP-D-mannose 3', 5'-epimerase